MYLLINNICFYNFILLFDIYKYIHINTYIKVCINITSYSSNIFNLNYILYFIIFL